MTPAIHDTIVDLVSDLLYYDRKEDSTLPVGAIDEAVTANAVSIDEIVALFREQLERGINIKDQP